MITIEEIEIDNYRSIVGKPVHITFNSYNVIVGPNNSGKSNIVRALNLFFNGDKSEHKYNVDTDFPKFKDLSNRTTTRITVTALFEPDKDTKIEKAISYLESESGQSRLSNDTLKLRLEYSRRGSEQWRFVSKAGLRSIKADLITPVVDALRSSVRFKYLPVGRDVLSIIRNELKEELVRTIFSGWSGAVKTRREVNETIDTLLEKLQPSLSTSGEEITESMGAVFAEIKKLELKLPFYDLETMLPSLEPVVSDKYETTLDAKGSGIQTSSLLFFLKYLADHHPQRHNARVTFIWAIEEPESFLHPSIQKSMSQILQEFSAEVQTIITTHSPHFVPRNMDAVVSIIDKDSASPYSTIVIGNDYETARRLLGVSLLDSMYLYEHNVITEGPSDEIIIRGAWEKLYKENKVSIDPRTVRFFPGNNASGACSVYETLIQFGDRDVVNIFLVIDGDEAGKKALRGLLKRNKTAPKLRANKDYFQLNSDIEWLTSTRVMEVIAEERPAQVRIVKNIEEDITEFCVNDGYKTKVAIRIVELSTLDDFSEHLKLILKIEKVIAN